MPKKRVVKSVAKKEIASEGKEVSSVGKALKSIWGFIAWLTGVIVSLAVGFGLVSGTLVIPWISDVANGIITQTAGWIVVMLSILGVCLKIVDMFNR